MSKMKNKKLWKNIGIGVLTGALCIGAVAGIGALINKAEETTKTLNPSWAIGGLTEQGQYLDTKESIYTKDAFECQGLDIEIDFDNNISYQVFFYTNKTDFLSSTGKLTGNYDENSTPLFANYARVVITPEDDSKISWYEKSGYANQLTISVSKEQSDIEYSGNLMKVKGNGSYSSAGEWTPSQSTNMQYGFLFSEDLNIVGYEKLVVQMPKTIFDDTNTTISLRTTDGVNQKLDKTLFETKSSNGILTFEIENISSFENLRMYTSYDVDNALFASICIYGVK